MLTERSSRRITDGIVRRPAPAHTRAAVKCILVGQMAGTLCQHRIDLADRTAARTALENAGHGEASLLSLLDRALMLAETCKGSIDV